MTKEEARSKLNDLLDKSFLNKLAEIGKLYGWNGDYCELREFIENLHIEHGAEIPDLEPYEIED